MGGNAFTSFPVSAAGGWVELGRTTLGSPGDIISVPGLADKRYYMFLTNCIPSSNFREVLNYNNDAGTNYAHRSDINGGSATHINDTRWEIGQANEATQTFCVGHIANLEANEKLGYSIETRANTVGASNVPTRVESGSKWTNVIAAINRIDINNDQSGSFNTGSECVILEWSPEDVHTTNFWEELASVNASGSSTNLSSGTITAKKYLWVQAWLESTSAHVTNMAFNNDTTTYAYRSADDGAADATSPSDSHIEIAQSSSTALFVNMFIVNNSATEKLVIGHTVSQGTAGATTAPNRREFVGKWDNTSSQITEIDLDSSSGNWASNSIIKVWGSD